MSTAHVSSAPTAVTNLITAILAQPLAVSRPGFAFGVVRGAPLADQPLDDAIVIRKVTRVLAPLEIVGDGGFGRFREDYVIEVEVFSFRGGDAAVDVETRAWELVAAVELAVRSDLTIGGAVLDTYLEGNDMESEWDDQSLGRRCITTVLVHCWQMI